jgi:hypothetical protein
MKYLKKFENHAAYAAAESGLILPNVSLCVQENEVHYNPIVPPQPIAPVGRVQVFANPQCTEYADGQSDTVYVRLNQDFGIDDGITWGTGPNDAENFLFIATAITEEPDVPYQINLWIDWNSINYYEPFTSGQIVECTAPNGARINNPKVIFE